MHPLSLIASHRSGTTWMMSQFDGCESIVVDRRYPLLEQRLLGGAYAGFLAINGSHNDVLAQLQTGDSLRHTNPELEGQSAVALMSVVKQHYVSLAEEQGLTSPVYFAEKCNIFDDDYIRMMALADESAKTIMLVRHPLDVYLSWKEHFVANANVEAHAEQAVSTMACRLPGLYAAHNDSIHVVRYEDAMENPSAEIAKIAEHLGISITPVDSTGRFPRHASSASTAASIGRGARELPAETVERLLNSTAYFCQTFGYE